MSGSARTSLAGTDREKLDQVIEPIARAHGAEVADLELKPERGGWILRVLVEKLGASADRLSTQLAAIDLDACSNIAHDLGTALDVADIIPHSYNLEVGSPGIERPLRRENDYVRFAGTKAKLKLVSPVRGQKVIVGVLGPVDGGKVAIQDGGRAYEIPLADIESARLVFEFGPPASKPGKPNGRKARGK